MKKTRKPSRRMRIVGMARECCREAGVEIDDNAKLSESDDNGTYIAAWLWVGFSGTPECKGDRGNHEDCEAGCPVWDKVGADANA